jgi:hypothetical protein
MTSSKMKRFHMPITLCLGVFLTLAAPAEQPAAKCLDTVYPKLEAERNLPNSMQMISRTTGLQVCGYFETEDIDVRKTMALTHFTGREAMEALVTIWPEYEWFEGPGNVVVVLPRGKIDDPEFFLNTIVGETQYENALIGESFGVLNKYLPKWPTGNLGIVSLGSGLTSPQQAAFKKSARFTATIPETTLLDHMNQVMHHFDGVSSWVVGTGNFNTCFVDIPRSVKTVALQEADAYAASSGMNPEELLRKYDAAAASAPLEALRMAIGMQKAHVHMQHRPWGSNSLREADVLSRQILDSDDPALLGMWTETMDIRIDLCLQQNDTDAVYSQFLELAQKSRDELRAVAVPAPYVMKCLHRLEYHRRPGADVTALLREQYGSNPTFADYFNRMAQNQGSF